MDRINWANPVPTKEAHKYSRSYTQEQKKTRNKIYSNNSTV